MSFLINSFVFGGGPPILFTWNPETEALPGTATFTRASVAFYRNDSGVWVEQSSGNFRLHNATTGGGAKGFLSEPAATKLALFPRDFTNAAWSASNITPVKDATGIDGVSNSASTLTADAGNGTILQTFTRASSPHTFSVFVARKTGTGTIEITVDGGTTWVDITSSISSDITDDPYIVTQTLANPSIGFRIVTSGDEIEVDMGDLEATAYATTPLDHTSSTATRAADDLDGPTLTSEYSSVFDMTFPSFIDGSTGRPGWFRDDGTPIQWLLNSATSIRAVGGGFDVNFTTSSLTATRHKLAMSAKLNELISIDDEGNSSTGSSGTLTPGTMFLGRNSTGLYFRGVIHIMTVYSVSQTQAALEALVA